MKYYKLLTADGSACNGGSGKWDLPKGREPGAWMPPIASPELGCRGYHGVPVSHLLDWSGATLYEMAIKGAVDKSDEKIATEQARLTRRIQGWSDKNLRLFAADCAEHVLDIYLKTNPEDGGLAPMLAIHMAREFAYGRANLSDLAAAKAAAWAAAGDAAWAAGWDAAGDAAWDAARAAAWDAAWEAARDAAREAAGYAAGDAAGAAARAAAWTAARAAQNKRLTRILNKLLGGAT